MDNSPEHAICSTKRGLTKQPTSLDDLASSRVTIHRDDAVSEEQRQRDKSRHDEDDDSRRQTVSNLQTQRRITAFSYLVELLFLLFIFVII